MDWIRRDKADTFSLGPSLGSLAGGYYKSNDLISTFHYEAALTKVIFNETIQLAELVGKDVFYLAKEEVPSPVRLVSEPGMRFPAHSTALGKVLLSDLAIDQLIQLFPPEPFVQVTPHTIQMRQALVAELSSVVELGYGTDLEESVLGFCCVATPIVKQGRVVSAVSCSMPKHHWELNHDGIACFVIITGVLRQPTENLFQSRNGLRNGKSSIQFIKAEAPPNVDILRFGWCFFCFSYKRRGVDQVTDHDRLFKELIKTFFKEFIQLFFPEVYKVIDFEHVKFLSEEVFTDIVKGSKRKVDVLIETKLKGETALIIVHFESQAQFQEDFSDRMFVYFSRLYEKYRRRILPIAIFSYNEARNEENLFELSFPFLDVLKFQFLIVELRKNKWLDFIKQDNPVAAALLSKMSYTEEERVQVKIEFLRMLVRLELDPARMRLITGIFDTYLKLNDIEEHQLRKGIQMLDRREEEKIMELKSNWEKTAELRGELKGKIQGKLEGKLEGERTILIKFIKAQFGTGSKEMVEQIACLTNLDQVDRLTDKLFSVSRIEEARKLVEEASKEQEIGN